jgi:hypothetical protein
MQVLHVIGTNPVYSREDVQFDYQNVFHLTSKYGSLIPVTEFESELGRSSDPGAIATFSST